MALRKDDDVAATKERNDYLKKKRYITDLQLFADGGGEGAEVGAGENNADAGQKGAFDSREKEFSQLINGKFKEQFSKKTQEIIDKRFKHTKELEDYKSKAGKTISSVLEICGLTEGEEDRIPEILEGLAGNSVTDTEENQQSVQEYVPADEPEKVEPANTENSEKFSRKDLARRFLPRAQSLVRQISETAELYPDFNIKRELGASPLFGRLVAGGVDVKTAYETVHRERLLTDAMEYTAKAVKEKIVGDIHAKGLRPLENGVVSQNAVVSAVDVNALTSKDILKILKQVESGKSVSFGHL